MDESGVSNFVMWDQECNNTIDISAPDLRNKMIEVQIIIYRLHYLISLSYVKEYYILIPDIEIIDVELNFILGR